MIVSPSISLVAAGVASGICFILLSSIRKGRQIDSRRKRKEFVPDDSRCACCLKPFLIGRGVQCSDCNVRSCRKGCSRWDTSDNAWHCLFCHQRRSWLRRNDKWFETFGGVFEGEELHKYFSTAKSRVYVAGVENAIASSSADLATGGEEQAHTMETVRDFVEKIVESLIGNVDDTPIDRLYDHPAYDRLLEKYSALLAEALARLAASLRLSLTNKPSTDSPSMAHTALRELVERAVEEARKLPGLGGSGDNSANVQEGRSIAEQSYEDLLATAILNKVIEKFQREQVDGNSNVLLGKSSSTSKYTLSESELGLDEGVEEGSSSLEPLSQDECSSDCSVPRTRHARNHQEPLSLTIEERIEEVTTTYTSDEEPQELNTEILSVRNTRRVPFPEFGMDIVDPSQESEDSQDEPDTPTIHMDVVSPIETWEENWLFQRKRAQTQPDSVAMLVPNSSADYKALIGDKDAEDTSDLSECSSAQSDEEIEKELMEAIDNVVPRSPRRSESDPEELISGKVESISGEIKEGIPRIDNGIEPIYRVNGASINGESTLSNPNLVTNGNLTENLNNKIDEEIVKLENQTIASHEMKDVKSAIKEEMTKVESADSTDKLSYKNVNRIDSPKKHVDNKPENRFDSRRNNSERYVIDEKSKNNYFADNYSTESQQNNASEETVSPELPKTPTSTPIRTSETEIEFESNEGIQNFMIANEKVLNSLESAKKILMDVEEEQIEEKINPTLSRLVFHVEEEVQQESEYTEHYDTATQRHLESLTKSDFSTGDNDSTKNDAPVMTRQSSSSNSSSSQKDSKCREALASAKAESAPLLYSKKNSADEDSQLATPPRPGTIAEREHKKWENAPPIENNPYSPESIQRRLWERQYSRRSADIPGVHTELPKSNGAELEVNLEPHQPDIKRFGRDYYINESKAANGERTRAQRDARSTASVPSRPSSSLSQRSNSTSAEQEQQEESQDTDSGSSNDVKSKVAKWQRNNAEMNGSRQQINRKPSKSACNENEEMQPQRNDTRKVWRDEKDEDVLENERRNNKNELNAKLNNRETIFDTRKNLTEENQRKIRKIDLKAYGFENEFSNGGKINRTSSQRVVNKLDLKSFGYDGGLRRTQSNNQIDSTIDTDLKPRIVKMTNKSSNLKHANDYRNCDRSYDPQDRDDENFRKSTETLNKIPGEIYGTFGSMKSAKSVPNIAKCTYYSNGDEEDENKLHKSRKVTINPSESQDEDEIEENVSFSADSEYDPEETSSDRDHDENVTKDMEEKIVENKSKGFVGKKLSLPSVRRLAEAFNRPLESAHVSKTARLNGTAKDRSSTPEIHIVETPRQMHSLTARSLSKQFREGLRQIPNKVTSPPASHVAMERTNSQETETEIVQSNGDKSHGDIGVILPGKLKSNIIFWEQMQRRS